MQRIDWNTAAFLVPFIIILVIIVGGTAHDLIRNQHGTYHPTPERMRQLEIEWEKNPEADPQARIKEQLRRLQ